MSILNSTISHFNLTPPHPANKQEQDKGTREQKQDKNKQQNKHHRRKQLVVYFVHLNMLKSKL